MSEYHEYEVSFTKTIEGTISVWAKNQNDAEELAAIILSSNEEHDLEAEHTNGFYAGRTVEIGSEDVEINEDFTDITDGPKTEEELRKALKLEVDNSPSLQDSASLAMPFLEARGATTPQEMPLEVALDIKAAQERMKKPEGVK